LDKPRKGETDQEEKESIVYKRQNDAESARKYKK
jgi:hypothetical protein